VVSDAELDAFDGYPDFETFVCGGDYLFERIGIDVLVGRI